MSLGERGRGPGQFNLISSVAVGPQDEIIVADARLQVRADFLPLTLGKAETDDDGRRLIAPNSYLL